MPFRQIMRFHFINSFKVVAVAIPLGLLLQCLSTTAVDVNWNEPGEDCFLVGKYERRALLKHETEAVFEEEEGSNTTTEKTTTEKPPTDRENLFTYLGYTEENINRHGKYYDHEDPCFNATMHIAVHNFDEGIMSLSIATLENETVYDLKYVENINKTERKTVEVPCRTQIKETRDPDGNRIGVLHHKCELEAEIKPKAGNPGVCEQEQDVTILVNKTHNCTRDVPEYHLEPNSTTLTADGTCKLDQTNNAWNCEVQTPETNPETVQDPLEEIPPLCSNTSVDGTTLCKRNVIRTQTFNNTKLVKTPFTDCLHANETNIPVPDNTSICAPHVRKYNETHESIKNGVDFEGESLYVDRPDIPISPTIENCELTLVKEISKDRQLTQVFKFYACGCNETLTAFDVENNITHTVKYLWKRKSDWKWNKKAQADCEKNYKAISESCDH